MNGDVHPLKVDENGGPGQRETRSGPAGAQGSEQFVTLRERTSHADLLRL